MKKYWPFYCKWRHSGERSANPSIPELPNPGFGVGFKESTGTGMRKRWRGRFSLEDLGAWPFMVRSVITGSSWTTDPLLLEVFRCTGSGHVQVLWFRVQLKVKVLSSAHASAAWLVVLACGLCKAAQYLYRTGWFWAVLQLHMAYNF